ncbi:MAG: hypothetical protein CMN30_04265 [Sandaracinus sp.]|nr:hypothetical protein [Sandaracinus sp.]|tara:strand:+ start:263 stop:1777 length:1515 start_codon:yes stop_codon:yes gene_type:complete
MSRQDDSPVDEEKRLAALRRYDVLDTPPDGAFDRVAALARRWFKAPVGLVSLVDEDRIWFKAKDGLSIPQIPREPGLCSSVVASDTVTYEVLDALNDPRTAQNSLVTGDFGLRFYAAAPIIVDSEYRIGTVCVLDFEPRGALSDDDRAVLADLASIVVDELHLRLRLRERAAQIAQRADELRRASLGRVALGLTRELGERLRMADAFLEELEDGGSLDPAALGPLRKARAQLVRGLDASAPFTRLNESAEGRTPEPIAVVPALRAHFPDLPVEAKGSPKVSIPPFDFELLISSLHAEASRRSPDQRVSASVSVSRDSEGRTGAAIAFHHAGPKPPDSEVEALFDPMQSRPPLDLRMAICRALVSGHGGRVEVSESDSGTTWSAWLPAIASPDVIVLVEDDDLVRSALARALGGEYQVLTFANAAEAAAEVDPLAIRALVTDHNLPGGESGVELARRMRETAPDLPVVVITGYRLEGTGDDFVFLRKPFSMAELRERIAVATQPG